jgi:ABC-type amino acid transport system permease subunit
MEQPPTSLSDAPLSLEEQPSFIRRPEVRKIIYACLAVAFLLMVVWPMIVHLQDPDFQKHI